MAKKEKAQELVLANNRIEARFDLSRGARLSALVDLQTGRTVVRQEGQRLIAGRDHRELAKPDATKILAIQKSTLAKDPHFGPGQTVTLRMATELDGQKLELERRIDLPDQAGAVRILDTWKTKGHLAGTWYSELGRFALPQNARCRVHDWYTCSDQSNYRLQERSLKQGRDHGILLSAATKDGQGVFFWKEGPAPDSRPIKGDFDFDLTDDSLAIVGTGFARVADGKPRRSDAIVVGLLEDANTLLGLRRWQMARYRQAGQPGTYQYIANTWQAFSLNVNEEKVMGEIVGAGEAGFDVLTIDDGWFTTFMGEVDPQKFPSGFDPLVQACRKNDMHLGLWMNPLGMDTRDPRAKMWDGAESHDTITEGNPWNWIARTSDYIPCETYISEGVRGYFSMDLCNSGYFNYLRDRLVNFATKQDIKHYKFDLYQLEEYDALTGDAHEHYEAYRRFLDELKKVGIIIEMDITRSNRPCFDFGLDYGRMFLANRGRKLKDHRWYYPWISLANLWDAARMAPAQLIELDIMPQLDEWPLEYVMATALVANPLCFAHFAAMPSERRQAIRQWIDANAELKSQLASRLILPVGERPAADNWSGFVAMNPDGSDAILIAYRNGAKAAKEYRFDLRGLGLGRPTVQIDLPLGYQVIHLMAKA